MAWVGIEGHVWLCQNITSIQPPGTLGLLMEQGEISPDVLKDELGNLVSFESIFVGLTTWASPAAAPFAAVGCMPC